MNTWQRPKFATEVKAQLKKRKGKEHQIKTKEIHKQKAITWTSISKINRQIDYIMINRRFRSSIRAAQTIQGWKANMQQWQQHNAIYMQICIKLMENYRKGRNPETCAKFRYNIQDLKLYP